MQKTSIMRLLMGAFIISSDDESTLPLALMVVSIVPLSMVANESDSSLILARDISIMTIITAPSTAMQAIILPTLLSIRRFLSFFGIGLSICPFFMFFTGILSKSVPNF